MQWNAAAPETTEGNGDWKQEQQENKRCQLFVWGWFGRPNTSLKDSKSCVHVAGEQLHTQNSSQNLSGWTSDLTEPEEKRRSWERKFCLPPPLHPPSHSPDLGLLAPPPPPPFCVCSCFCFVLCLSWGFCLSLLFLPTFFPFESARPCKKSFALQKWLRRMHLCVDSDGGHFERAWKYYCWSSASLAELLDCS